MLQGGYLGVDVFFVLRGFLITTLIVEEFDRAGSVSLKNFYIRRILRLAPALIALLTVYCIVSLVTLSENLARKNYLEALITAAYLSNWARAFSIHPPDFLGHTWSLSIEEQFYMLWPILLLGLLRWIRRRSHVVLIAVALALVAGIERVLLAMAGATSERLYNGLDTRADA